MWVLVANEWNRFPNSRMPAVTKSFRIEKFLREFSFSGISPLNVSAFYMLVPYTVAPCKKSAYVMCVKLYGRYKRQRLLLCFSYQYHFFHLRKL